MNRCEPLLYRAAKLLQPILNTRRLINHKGEMTWTVTDTHHVKMETDNIRNILLDIEHKDRKQDLQTKDAESNKF
jgi:hypothetical protein